VPTMGALHSPYAQRASADSDSATMAVVDKAATNLSLRVHSKTRGVMK
jgi:hypothetical protein